MEDLYTYFVEIFHISEELFWYSEWSVLQTILENKLAVDEWKAFVDEKMRERK